MNKRDYIAAVKRLPCEICVLRFCEDAEPWSEPCASDAHHPRTGIGAGRRAKDEDVIALCKEHHQGKTGIHGMGRKAFEREYDVTEAQLSASTRRRVNEMGGV